MARCKACGTNIKYLRTAKNQRLMPVDVKPITVVTQLGHVIKAYTPHWATCPGADPFRKPKSNDGA